MESQRCVIQLEFFKRAAQILKILGFYGVDTGKDHGFYFLEAGDGFLAWPRDVGDGVAHLDFARCLDAGYDVSYVACAQLLAGYQVHFEYAYLVSFILLAGVEELHFVPLADDAVLNLEVGDDATEGVEHRVEDECLQRGFLVAYGVGDAADNSFKNLGYAHSRLAGGTDDFFAFAAKEFDDFVLHFIGVGAGHVALVDDRDDFEVMFDGHIQVRYGLRLYALRGVHDEQCAFAGSDGAGYFVGEVHVSRSVNEVEDILLSVQFILHLYGVALDGDATFALQVHVVQHLSFGHLYGVGIFQQAVCQGGLAVVDVGDNAKVADILHLCRCYLYIKGVQRYIKSPTLRNFSGRFP